MLHKLCELPRIYATSKLAPVASCKTSFAEHFVAEPEVQNERMKRRSTCFGNSACRFDIVNREGIKGEYIAMSSITGWRTRTTILTVSARCARIEKVI